MILAAQRVGIEKIQDAFFGAAREQIVVSPAKPHRAGAAVIQILFVRVPAISGREMVHELKSSSEAATTLSSIV